MDSPTFDHFQGLATLAKLVWELTPWLDGWSKWKWMDDRWNRPNLAKEAFWAIYRESYSWEIPTFNTRRLWESRYGWIRPVLYIARYYYIVHASAFFLPTSASGCVLLCGPKKVLRFSCLGANMGRNQLYWQRRLPGAISTGPYSYL